MQPGAAKWSESLVPKVFKTQPSVPPWKGAVEPASFRNSWKSKGLGLVNSHGFLQTGTGKLLYETLQSTRMSAIIPLRQCPRSRMGWRLADTWKQ